MVEKYNESFSQPKLEPKKNEEKDEISQGSKEPPKNPGEYILNPNGGNKFFSGETADGVLFNAKLKLNEIQKIGNLDVYSRWTGDWYQVERIIENTDEDFLNEEVIINLLEWSREGGRKKKGQYESYIIKPLLKKNLVNPAIVDWLLERGLNDHSFLAIAGQNLLNQEQLRQAIIKTKTPYVYGRLLESMPVKERAMFTVSEIKIMYFGAEKQGRNSIFGEIAEHIFPYIDEESRKKFIQEVLENIISDFSQAEKSFIDGKDSLGKMFTEMPLHSPIDDHNEDRYLRDAIRSVTHYGYKYLSDDQLIDLMIHCPTDSYSHRLPGWVHYGLNLSKYKKYYMYERYAIRDCNNAEYQKHYERMEKIFARNAEQYDKTFSEKDKERILHNVKDIGLNIFRPIYVAAQETGGAQNVKHFTHVSGQQDLKCLLPSVARDTDRHDTDWATYIQAGQFSSQQFDYLNRVNEEKLYSYNIFLSDYDMQRYVEKDDREWEGGYRTKHPIILDKNIKLEWSMFNDIMKEESFSQYEHRYGEIPLTVKKKLMKETFVK